jgi:hypothetical protein
MDQLAKIRQRAERRIERVSDRMALDDTPDDVLDDFFVLWRAFESTFDRPRHAKDLLLNRAIRATEDTLVSARVSDLQTTVEFARNFYDRFADTDIEYIQTWFPQNPGDRSNPAHHIRSNLHELKPALSGRRWRESDSRALAVILYYMRNAIFHGSFATSRLESSPRAFAGIRECMIGLVRSRLQRLVLAARR